MHVQATEETSGMARVRPAFLGLPFDPLDQRAVLAQLRARAPGAAFAYVATPNVQHVVQADRDPEIRPWIEDAWLSLCDSRPLRKLAGWRGLDLPLVTGSDLTVALFTDVIEAGDRISVVCPSESLAIDLRARRSDLDWDILVPPPGTDPGTEAFAAAIRFVAASGARFTFVCLGAPKSEAICHAAARIPGATGTALCTGASLEFMLGLKKRAPLAFQRLGLEWLYRMLSEPRRLSRRYLGAILPLIRIWLKHGQGRKG